VAIPTKEKDRVLAPSGSTIEKFPSRSVIAPVVVPTTATETPGTGDPDWSVTVPVIVFSCCDELEADTWKMFSHKITANEIPPLIIKEHIFLKTWQVIEFFRFMIIIWLRFNTCCCKVVESTGNQ
jgi:hypothetical protein